VPGRFSSPIVEDRVRKLLAVTGTAVVVEQNNVIPRIGQYLCVKGRRERERERE